MKENKTEKTGAKNNNTRVKQMRRVRVATATKKFGGEIKEREKRKEEITKKERRTNLVDEKILNFSIFLSPSLPSWFLASFGVLSLFLS